MRVSGDINVPAGVTLSVDPGSVIQVSPSDDASTRRTELIVGGTLNASAGEITFRSSNDDDDASRNDWYGIRVGSGGSADLSGATIRDAHRCVQSHDAPDTTPAPVTMTDATELTHCGLTVSLVPSPPRVGHPVTASVVDPTGTVTGDWQWQRRLNDEDSWEDITQPARTTRQSSSVFPGLSVYTPVLTDMGQMLRVRMHYQDGSDLYNYVHSPVSQAVASGRPHAPGGLDPEEGDGHVVLNWNAAVDNGSSLLNYESRRSPDDGSGARQSDQASTWTPWGDIGLKTTHRVESLTNGTEYSFEVRAVNAVGSGDSSRVKATPERPDTPGRVELSTNQPRVGQELTPTLIDPDSPALAEAPWRWRRQRWPRSDDGDSLSAPAPGSRSGESKLGVIARTRQYRPQVSDLNQWLWVEVTYTDDFGGHRVSATTSRAVGPGPPCAPANLKAAPGDGQVTLTWEAGCNNGGTIDRYQYRRPEAVKWVRVPGDGSARRQQVEGLTNGEAHTFEVRARNGQGWGPAAQATATPAAAESPPPPPPPPPVTVTYEASSYAASEGGRRRR